MVVRPSDVIRTALHSCEHPRSMGAIHDVIGPPDPEIWRVTLTRCHVPGSAHQTIPHQSVFHKILGFEYFSPGQTSRPGRSKVRGSLGARHRASPPNSNGRVGPRLGGRALKVRVLAPVETRLGMRISPRRRKLPTRLLLHCTSTTSLMLPIARMTSYTPRIVRYRR